MRRTILHIGMPRTGSTSFQTLLATLRPRRARRREPLERAIGDPHWRVR